MTCDNCHGPVPNDDPDVERKGDSWTCGDCSTLDTQSSASRQHYIDTGYYLTPDEVREYAADDPGELAEAEVLDDQLADSRLRPVTVHVDRIIAYEAGELSSDEALQLIADLVRSGQAWHLQGSYGRFAAQLIMAGRINEHGDILEVGD